ncbi:MAG: hypothetical protein QXL94_00215 [Candidatus Parvarchaeum sp.]
MNMNNGMQLLIESLDTPYGSKYADITTDSVFETLREAIANEE